MQTIKKVTIALFGTLLLSGTAAAEVTRECILTGHVHDTSRDGTRGEVRVTFHNAENGAEAPCRMGKGKTRARIQFKAKTEDRLHALPDGSTVKYRYQRRNGKDQWELLRASEI